MRTNFDFSPFRRSTVGFDRLFELMENGSTFSASENYPPFDLEEDEDRYRITIAVAGFRQDEIDVTAQQSLLIVSGRKAEEEDERRYVHRGIAARSFERRFVLGDYVRVKSAEMKDGLLSIELAREIPDEMKPRKIEVVGARSGSITDQSAGNDNGHRRAA